MTNEERCSKEMLAIVYDTNSAVIAVDKNTMTPIPCQGTSCGDCYLFHHATNKTCRDALRDWAAKATIFLSKDEIYWLRLNDKLKYLRRDEEDKLIGFISAIQSSDDEDCYYTISDYTSLPFASIKAQDGFVSIDVLLKVNEEEE